MKYPIPETLQDIIELGLQPVSPEAVAAAIAGVIAIARGRGQTLDDLIEEVLADDRVLDAEQRDWLRGIVTQAWEAL